MPRSGYARNGCNWTALNRFNCWYQQRLSRYNHAALTFSKYTADEIAPDTSHAAIKFWEKKRGGNAVRFSSLHVFNFILILFYRIISFYTYVLFSSSFSFFALWPNNLTISRNMWYDVKRTVRVAKVYYSLKEIGRESKFPFTCLDTFVGHR